MFCFAVCAQPVEELAPPADFVRASMSVPVFFQPLTIPYRNSSGSERGAVHYGGQLSRQGDKWDKRHGVLGKIPTRAVFCDGEGELGIAVVLHTLQTPQSDSNEFLGVHALQAL